MRSKPLALTTGDPGGVGPEVALVAAASAEHDACLIFGDARALRDLAGRAGVRARMRDVAVADGGALEPGEIGLVDAGVRWGSEACKHEATAFGGAAQLAALDAAIAAARAGQVRAIVTAPMSKAAVNLAGHEFSGHTEHLARAAGLADDDVTMMFLGPQLRVALVTTHLAVRDLPAAITSARVYRTILHTADAALRLSRPGVPPRILVSGLNPHAGEDGLFGDEEPRAIAPAIARARMQAPFSRGLAALEGPIGAETAFRRAAGDENLFVVAMAHDQATIASKLLDWTQAVNVTWGLPFVRTSVDHGVAYDAAASRSADSRGMISALAMAQRLTRDPAAEPR